MAITADRTTNGPQADHLTTTATFADLGVDQDLIDVLAAQGIDSPFPIQAMAVPDALEGRDVCGKAKTGSGKTLAFGLPIAQHLEPVPPKRPAVLVLVPTRELCVQVAEALQPLAEARDCSVLAVYGGVPMRPQIEGLRRGAEVVVATPGRLIDLESRRAVNLDAVGVVVIDEADEMADMGFLPQVHHILRGIPRGHQTMLFSATLDGQVGALIRSYMTDPVFHEVQSGSITVETSLHRFLQVHHMDKPKVAARIAASAGRTLVFVRTKAGCARVARDLQDVGVRARAIHGNLPQAKRERMLAELVSGKSPVLVATNVAARGLDIEDVDVVIHYDAPEDAKTYLHRSGRTARAGEAGLVVTFVEWDQLDMVARIQHRAGLHEPVVKMFSNDERLDDLAGWEPPAADRPLPARNAAARRFGRRKRRR